MLTALAAMIAAAVILADPIFQASGLASSTLLTVLVIPAIYVVLGGKDDGQPERAPDTGRSPVETAPAQVCA